LHYAAANGQVDVIKVLIDTDADLNFVDKVTYTRHKNDIVAET